MIKKNPNFSMYVLTQKKGLGEPSPLTFLICEDPSASVSASPNADPNPIRRNIRHTVQDKLPDKGKGNHRDTRMHTAAVGEDNHRRTALALAVCYSFHSRPESRAGMRPARG